MSGAAGAGASSDIIPGSPSPNLDGAATMNSIIYGRSERAQRALSINMRIKKQKCFSHRAYGRSLPAVSRCAVTRHLAGAAPVPHHGGAARRMPAMGRRRRWRFAGLNVKW